MFGEVIMNFSWPLFSVAAIIILAAIFAFLARYFKQPLIPVYILAGIVLGPLVLGMIKDMEIIKSLSEIGIAFLLFIIGLQMDLKKLKEVGLFSGIIGLVQVVLTFLLSFFVSTKLGFSEIEAVYIGLILAFSSTMVVVKLLSDKGKLHTLHGRIIIGILLVQDLIVIFALSFLNSFNNFSYLVVANALINGLLLLLIAIFVNMVFLKHVFKFAAKSQELLFLTSVGVCFIFILLAHYFGFSITIGAFIAGVGLAVLPYSFDIVGVVKPLKDFFATIFFVSLGMEIVFFNLIFEPLYYFLLIVILFKPLVVMLCASVFGYERRTSFLSSISLAQISEFSLIIAAQGLVLGLISQELFSMTVLIAIITIILTSYLIKHEDYLYNKVKGFLGIFEGLNVFKHELGYVSEEKKEEIVLFGCNRMGSLFLNIFRRLGKAVYVVDNNPEIIRGLMNDRICCVYGDAANLEVFGRLNLRDVGLIISTIPDEDLNLFLIRHIRKYKNKKIIVTAEHVASALVLYKGGADYVIIPHVLSGELIGGMLRRILKDNFKSLEEMKEEHIKHLKSLKVYGEN